MVPGSRLWPDRWNKPPDLLQLGHGPRVDCAAPGPLTLIHSGLELARCGDLFALNAIQFHNGLIGIAVDGRIAEDHRPTRYWRLRTLVKPRRKSDADLHHTRPLFGRLHQEPRRQPR